MSNRDSKCTRGGVVAGQGWTFGALFQEYILQCRGRGALGTARNYERTFRSFCAFLGPGGADVPLGRLDAEMVGQYEIWLQERGVVRNSSSFYLRNLRALYNKAVRRGLVEQHADAFYGVYTGIDSTRKRAMGEVVILQLLKLDLRSCRSLELSRDLFVFSYCTRGMSFVDMAFLRKEDVRGGVIHYVRRKTSQRLSVRIEPCIGRIIEKYAGQTSGSKYVFPILTTTAAEDAYRQYAVALNYHNRKLKTLGRLIGLDVPLSSYIARHSWATAARRHNVPISVISASMGHSSEKTTQIYLDALDGSVIDDANRGILGCLNDVVSMQETI